MNEFKKRVEKMAPVLESKYSLTPVGVIAQYYGLSNKRRSQWEGMKNPYIEDTIWYLESCNGRLPKYLMLVSEDKNLALKSATYMIHHAEEFVDDADDYYGYYDDDGIFIEDENEFEEMVRVIDLAGGPEGEKSGVGNAWAPLLVNTADNRIVLFTGLQDESGFAEKLEVMGACPADTICIYMHPSQLKTEWAKKVLMELQCEILEISTPTDAYYEKLLTGLLSAGDCKLEKKLAAKKLLHKIRKSRGEQFKEEDIAWYLDKALENKKRRGEEDNILESKDFKELFVSEETAMEKLQNMTGLENVKKLAKEMASITLEEMNNDKLGILHKNMIFMGNPGTGKTTCAQLLAEIMFEEGNTNANFVVADRKKLIGKYVGHTAPKVAKMFEEAKGGVLFVDEAGFFLNQGSGGYVEEAMKEFIRYMELYPEVTVIFAMYSDEVSAFLELDSGLTSRISRFVNFEDYSLEELSEITVKFLQEKGYCVEAEVKESIRQSLGRIREARKKKFGNAREARKLAEAAIIAASVRKYGVKKRDNQIMLQDIQEGFEKLRAELDKKQKLFGFQNEVNDNRKLLSYR